MAGPALKLAQISAHGSESSRHDAALAVAEALHTLRVAVTLFDAGERLVYANAHFGYLFRSMPRDGALIGRRYEDLIRLEIDGGETAEVADIEAYIARRRAQLRDSELAPLDIRLADGRIIEIKARRTTDGGWIALWTDATHARHQLQRLESTLALSADAFAFFDRSDRLVLCTTVYAQLHGHGLSDDLVGRTAAEIAQESGERGLFRVDGTLEEWLELRREAHAAPAGALTLVAASGAAYLVRERATADGYVSVFTDVTDARRVESALAEQTAALERTKRALAQTRSQARKQRSHVEDLVRKLGRAEAEAHTTKNTLLRTMSHELKTPLNAIIGFSDFLTSMADRADPQQVRDYATLIHQSGHNLLRLINQILDLTKLAAGRYELRRQSVDAGISLLSARDACAARAAAKSISVVVEDCTSGILADADENAMNQMVGQLVSNAVSFTQPGGEVRLSATREGQIVRVVVSDNGPGVAAEDIPRILLPFEQAGRDTDDHADGAGLGLTLVTAFAQLHGGRLRIQSAVGEGFAATLELPAARA